MLYQTEFLYRNIQVVILKEFGWVYLFRYGGKDYFPIGTNFATDQMAKDKAKKEIDIILLKKEINGDELDLNV